MENQAFADHIAEARRILAVPPRAARLWDERLTIAEKRTLLQAAKADTFYYQIRWAALRPDIQTNIVQAIRRAAAWAGELVDFLDDTNKGKSNAA